MGRANTSSLTPAFATRLVLIGLTLVTVLAFWRVQRCGFVYDDILYVTKNAHVREGLTPDSIRWALTSMEASNWHPLTWLSLELDYQLYGLDAAGFHRTNLLLHLASTLVLFLLLLRWTGELWPTTVVAGLFALHPMHVESVAWVSERKDVLSGLLFLLTLGAYTRYVDHPSVARYLLVASLFALGLMAKPMLVTLPAVLLLLDYWPLERMQSPAGSSAGDRWRSFMIALPKLALEKVPLFALSAASAVMTWVAQERGRSLASLETLSATGRIANALVAYAEYLGSIFWPYPLAVFYPYPRFGWPLWQVASAALVLLIVSALTLRWAGRRPYLAVGWFWFLGMLVPVIGLVQVGSQSLADRYTYLPYIGLFLLLAWGGRDLIRSLSLPALVPIVASGIAVAACFVLTWLQVGFWKDSLVLWQHAVDVTQENYIAEYNLGVALANTGHRREAREHYEEALRIKPDYAEAHNNLGLLLQQAGDQAGADPHFAQAAEADASNPNIAFNYARALARQGRADEASQLLQRVVAAVPDYAPAWTELGLLAARNRRWEEAAHDYRQALRADPEHVEAANNLGLALAQLGRPAEAAQAFRQAVQVEPNNLLFQFNLAHALMLAGKVEEGRKWYQRGLQQEPRWPDGAYQAAWDLATNPDPRRRDGTTALWIAQQLTEVMSDPRPQYIEALAAAYAETGQFDQAVATIEKALRDSKESTSEANTFRERLALYQRHQPYRQPATQR